jgi:hypothetical protein
MRAMFRLGMAALVVAACTDAVNAPAIDPSTKLDETVFRCSVEPILARQCSYTACHGQATTALRVYTPGKLRAMPPANIDDAIAPLTDDEEHGNFTSASGFAESTAPVDNFLLRKPLPSSAGGFEHKGGAIYSGTKDAQYVAIAAWLAGSGACP